MSEDDIREAIQTFLQLLEKPNVDNAKGISTLEFALDRLGLAYHFAGDEFRDGYPEPPTQDYARFRQLAMIQFPNLGFYNIPSRMTEEIQTAPMSVGDALDDVADIACDLAKVVWCWEHNDAQDALWHFRFLYDTHWGDHLRHLQCYLHALKDKR